MSNISTHILDLSRGVAAANVGVTLERLDGASWTKLADAKTDADGRVKALLPAGTALTAATYKLSFASGSYFKALGVAAFHPSVDVVFVVAESSKHHHVPLLLSPFGYSTYRGT